MTKQSTPKNRWEEIKYIWTHEYTTLWIIPGILLGLCIGFIAGWKAQDGISSTGISNFIIGYLPDILTIGFTVTILYYFDQWRSDKREEKRLQEELLWQVKSRSNDVAISALERLRVKGWLTGEKGLLQGKDLRGVNWRGANLAEANLDNANISKNGEDLANLNKVNLANASLQGANLSGANLWEAQLQGANLNRATLEETNLGEANLCGAKLTSANLMCASIPYANLSDTDMRDANLYKATLHYTNFHKANMQISKLAYTDMRNANLSYADLAKASFDENTLLPNGDKWTSLVDMVQFTNPHHSQFRDFGDF